MNRKRMKLIWKKMLLCVVAAICLCGCGSVKKQSGQDGMVPAELTEDLIVVGFSQLGSESVWRTAHTASIQEQLTKEKGFFLEYNNARQRQENQIKAIRSYISQRVDCIVFSPVTETGWDTVLQEAKNANIPVIVVDRMVDVKDDSLYTTIIGMDAQEEGRKAGRWLEEFCRKNKGKDETINVLVMEGTAGSSAQIGRSEGFDEIAKTHDDWRVLEKISGEFTTTKGKEVMLSMLSKYQDIDVVVSQNDDMTFGIIEALQERGGSYGVDGDVTIISFDAVKEALELVADGKINVDIECNPLQGEQVAEVIRKLEAGQPVEKRYVVDGDIFTIDNVKSVLEQRKY